MKALKICGAIFCGFMTLGGIISIFPGNSTEPQVYLVIITLIFLLLTVLLIRSCCKGGNKRAREPSQTSTYLPYVPVETLRDMKKCYTAMQAQNDIRVMQESFHLAQQATDFDTFFMRLELSQQKALTLLQAVQAGCKGISNKQQVVQGCESILSNAQNAKIVFLDNSYKKETASAMQLKTKTGQHKRLCTYLERLQSHEDQFCDVEDAFSGFAEKLKSLIAETEPDNKSSAPSSRQSLKSSPADEIMKYKQLLDAGAITQEEYNAKKEQLLKQ